MSTGAFAVRYAEMWVESRLESMKSIKRTSAEAGPTAGYWTHNSQSLSTF
mgnify:CR=1 FL=1